MYEAKVYKHLSGTRKNTKNLMITLAGIPEMFYFGVEGDLNILVMELLGPNLEELFNFCGYKFKLATTLMIAEQTVFILVWIIF